MTYDPNMNAIPVDILDAAHRIHEWSACYSEVWELGPVCSRNHATKLMEIRQMIQDRYNQASINFNQPDVAQAMKELLEAMDKA